MALEFLSPAWLFSLLAIPIVWWGVRRRRDLLHRVLRTAALIALTCALAQPVWWDAKGAPHHVLVLDESASAAGSKSESVHGALSAWLRGLEGDARTSLVRFGESPTDTIVEGVEAFDDETFVAGTCGEALELAAARIPARARGSITLVTDGLARARDWGRATQALTARGVPVHTVRLDALEQDVRPVRLEPVGEWRVGEEARLVVDVVGRSNDLALVLESADGELARLDGVSVDGRGRFELSFEPAVAGFIEMLLRVEVADGADAHPGNENLVGVFAIQDPLRVLYLGGRQAGGAVQLAQLVGSGFRMFEGPAAESTVLDAASYDLVVLDDCAAESLPTGTQEELRDAVLGGATGLFMSGGQAAFGPGGYADGALADVLPVESVQKEEKRDPSTSLVVVIDTSGSMGGERVQLAKEVARLAVGRLLPHDKVGIVEFYGAKRWAAPLQPASNRIELQRALNRMDAGGGTVILPAIEEAFYGLQNVQTRYKHVLVLTDGGVERGAFEPLIRRMADKGITVSTVLIGGAAHSEFLVNIANWGKGRFYSVPDRFSLPEIILKQPTTTKLPAYRPGVHPVEASGPDRWWGDVERDQLPPLAGYVESKARDEAEVLMRTVEGGHPMLATWRTGLGRATAFMTEPTGAGTESWSEWSGYGPLLAHVLASTAADNRAEWSYRLEREGHRARLTATRRVPTDAQPRGLFLRDDEFTEVSFEERADGLQEATWAFDADEALFVLAGREGDERRLAASPRSDRAPELNVDPARALDLTRLSAATGGLELRPEGVASFVPPAGPTTAALGRTRLAPLALLLALACYLADIVHRRRPRVLAR
ncbi:MAG: VWA domain-containing protein [Planctomycetes bacterium]|nr:VWA domain-containing protein [Planctomycetota bacterium]MCB9905548.1 VWA domain-containing protein [Planctomycetota bacterium]